MKKELLVIVFTFINLFIIESSFTKSFSDLQVIPRDSTNAEKMKIWIPVKNSFCDVKVNILDDQNTPVRHLLERKISNGYYNIFWDKKDDSGKFVPLGGYKVAVIACSYRKIQPIDVSYRDGENSVYYTVDDYNDKPSLTVQLLNDSVDTRLDIYNNRDIFIENLFNDSVWSGGEHRVNWSADKLMTSGNYFFKLTLSGYEHWIPFTYKK